MTVYIVTDLGYGDAGKGTTVDYLARQGSAVVVRHSGGPQAAHNVVTDGGCFPGQHHTFSQFGSGTFAGASTYLSKHMLINPLNMEREAQHLIGLGETDIWDRTFVDLEARIITPFHIQVNWAEELARGEDRHGSCGQGIGVAQRQHLERPDLSIRVSDLGDSSTGDKLEALRTYLLGRNDKAWMQSYDLALEYFRWQRKIQAGFAREFPFFDDDNLIFEGAQGVLLDEWYGFHPYTTWSTTTHENALSLLADWKYDGEVVRLGVTRAYMTRHGPGPFVTEDASVQYDEPHNGWGRWQGGFRQGHLDFAALRYSIEVCGGIDQLVVTHLDRSDLWTYADGFRLPVGIKGDLDHQAELTEALFHTRPNIYMRGTGRFLRELEDRVAPIGMTSHGPTAAQKLELPIFAQSRAI